ncbi:class I SAM-dependent methyltransferase [Conexibacter woesei]|uniref:Methyltransferase type 11 n=1 Tax=Conexibacter woesei (strain DSM 14684 / CCUG 47730 / CIP 108061 / JCM 11494 / NBRC 100937 / ID131577) TaxID=469383 RepID=D3F8S6_CONWI|nr:class I SAM-dependent methyltransferase [Conexibacter woesei]ADB51040.1 Methyltransferase type 11 [Conexibacter woesei DSM 14684]
MAEPAAPAASVRNPLFARLYARVLARNEPPEMREHRRTLLAGLDGRVLEVGAGAGTNFPHYPAGVTEVVAVEPEPYLREQARAAAASASVPITVLEGVADALPAPDGAFDAAVACLVLCSVPDQPRALVELRRVLRPGGELRFFEHVRAHAPRAAALQRTVDRLFWPHAFGGCHTARDTAQEIERAGFAIEAQRRMRSTALKIPPPVAVQVLGIARRSS